VSLPGGCTVSGTTRTRHGRCLDTPLTRLPRYDAVTGDSARSASQADYSRRRLSARLGTTKDARKIGKNLFPVHRKATTSPSAALKV
jgi:hypothetical protein